MLKITKLTDYSLVLLCAMPYNDIISASALHEKTKIPLPTVNKILKLLVKNKLCSTKSGKNGGFILSHPLDTISLFDVVQAIEGFSQSFTECSTSHNTCQLQNFCKLSSKMYHINKEISDVLKNKKLSFLLAS